jgi:hypothetical protein
MASRKRTTRPHLEPAKGSEGYSFCEASTAGSSSRWHIRKLCSEGRKLTGGVTTSSLCGHVKPFPKGFGGWDLQIPITEHHLEHCCPECAEKLQERLTGKVERWVLADANRRFITKPERTEAEVMRAFQVMRVYSDYPRPLLKIRLVEVSAEPISEEDNEE